MTQWKIIEDEIDLLFEAIEVKAEVKHWWFFKVFKVFTIFSKSSVQMLFKIYSIIAWGYK